MFRKRYTFETKRRANLRLEKAQKELALAKEVLGIERETKYVQKQINLLEVADAKITKSQLSLMDSTNKKLVTAQIAGMKDQVEKSLPAMQEARHLAGEAAMTTSLKYLQSVKERAKV